MQHALTRRRILAGSAGVAAGVSSGCVSSLKSLLGGGPPNQVRVQIKAQPADQDTTSIRIARKLSNRLQSVGVGAEIQLLPADQLYEEVLMRHEFDIYVGRFPTRPDPDFLRSLFHSRYSPDLGWQNPFGFTDVNLDQRLDAQVRQLGETRRSTIGECLELAAQEQPMAPLVATEALAGIGTDRFEGWDRNPATGPLWLVGLDQANGSPALPQSNQSLTIATTNGTPTESLNPLHRRGSGLDITTSLLYDPLCRYYDGGVKPWLAESTWWSGDDGEDELVVRLKPNLQWHDGTPLTGRDVKFTYNFYSDASMDDEGAFAPVARYRSRTDLVSSIRYDSASPRTVGLTIDGPTDPVAFTALTVPLLPRHIWRERTSVVNADQGLTRAHVSNNQNPVGSGPMQFESRSNKESLTLSRYGNHPLNREADSRLSARFNELPITDLELLVAPSDLTVIEHVEEGNADVTAPTLGPSAVDNVEETDGIELSTSPSHTFYHIGFNTRSTPLRNPNFRRTVARCLDKEHIAESIFDGYARPLSTPMIDESWIPDPIAFDGTDPQVPFLGENGSFDKSAARTEFKKAGYRYTDGGYLVNR